MIGAIVGDVVGSRFEWNNKKSKEFLLFSDKCKPTDDTNMTLAVAKAILECEGDYSLLSEKTAKCMREVGRRYPNCGYGGAVGFKKSFDCLRYRALTRNVKLIIITYFVKSEVQVVVVLTALSYLFF